LAVASRGIGDNNLPVRKQSLDSTRHGAGQSVPVLELGLAPRQALDAHIFTLTPGNILALQRSIGNHAVQRLLTPSRGERQHSRSILSSIVEKKDVTDPVPPLIQRQQAAPKNNVTSIDPITGTKNALTSFPALPVSNCNLNSPGPLNDTTTGSCRNIHQIHFHLRGIRAEDVSLLRIVERTTIIGGDTDSINKSDGPSAEAVIRPNDSLIAVGDCPGFSAKSANPAAFPISYHAHFILSAHDSVQKVVLAKISYDVAIDKKTFDDPNPTNTFTVTDLQIF